MPLPFFFASHETCSIVYHVDMHGKIITDEAYAIHLISYLKDIGRVVVATHGDFDVLHRGHVEFLEKARAEGDVLLVAVSTYERMVRYGSGFIPVNTLEDRMAVLASLDAVRYVIPLPDPDASGLIRTLKPTMYVVRDTGVATEESIEEKTIREVGGGSRRIAFDTEYSMTRLALRFGKRPPQYSADQSTAQDQPESAPATGTNAVETLSSPVSDLV